MNDSSKQPGIVRLGGDVHRGIDPLALENDLAQLWKSAAADGSAVSRACLANIILAVPAGRNPVDLIEDITRLHPSRVLVVRPDPERRPGEVEAWVSATCNRGPDGVLVCCEAITLEIGPGGERSVPNAVRSLVVGSQPRVVLVEGVPWRDVQWVEMLGRSVDLVLADAATVSAADALELWRRCAKPGRRNYRDLVWTRLADWRQAMAVGFDGEDPTVFGAIREVRLEIANRPAALPGAALLLGWLASRLHWELRTGGTLGFTAGSKEIELTVERVEPGADPARIRTVTTRFEGTYPDREWKRLSAERRIEVWNVGAPEPMARFNRLKTSPASAVVREIQRHAPDGRAVEAMSIAAELLPMLAED